LCWDARSQRAGRGREPDKEEVPLTQKKAIHIEDYMGDLLGHGAVQVGGVVDNREGEVVNKSNFIFTLHLYFHYFILRGEEGTEGPSRVWTQRDHCFWRAAYLKDQNQDRSFSWQSTT